MKWKLAGWIALAALLVCAAQAQNDKAVATNALITQANEAVQNKQWQQAVDLFKQIVAIIPDEWTYHQGLGGAQLNLGKYDDALQSYEAGIKLAQAEMNGKAAGSDPAKAKTGIAMMLTSEGNVYLKQKKNDLAIAAYTRAAEMSAIPATAYFNLCATQYNMGNVVAAEVACDKAIAADPKKADAYFIKGSALYGDGKLDAQGKYILLPGTVEVLKKYLELAPDGAHVSDVKAMLDAAGVKY